MRGRGRHERAVEGRGCDWLVGVGRLGWSDCWTAGRQSAVRVVVVEAFKKPNTRSYLPT